VNAPRRLGSAEGDLIYYKLTITLPEGEPMRLAAKGTVKDDQVIRVEPMDPAVYSTMVARSR
jgi:hypothetical protein